MRRLAISRLLMIAVLVPLIGLGVFGARLTYDSWSRYSDISSASSVLRLAVATARFAGLAMPGEGSANRDTISGRGDRAKLDAARRTTDDLYKGIRDAAAALSVKDAMLDAQLGDLDERMRGVVTLRPRIDAGELKSPTESTRFISPASTVSVDLIGTTSGVVDDAVLSRRIFSLYATLQFIQNGLVQRGAGEVALREGKLTPEFFTIMARGTGLHDTFNKLFHKYASRDIIGIYDTFYAANGHDLEELRKLALTNSGQPASEAQIKRWVDISREIGGVFDRILAGAIDSVSTEGDQMLSSARNDLMMYLGVTLAVFVAVVLIGRKVLLTLRELLGELAGAMDKMQDGNYDVAIPHVKRPD